LSGKLIAAPPPVKMTGGLIYDIPEWFKISFLDIKEDLSEATSHGKQLLLFFHLDECPYCARALDENFREGSTKEWIEKNFDVIELNIRGGRPVTWLDGKSYTEVMLRNMLGIYATPTMLFIGSEGDIVLRLDGFRKRQTFRYVIDFVVQKAYHSMSLSDYIAKQKQTVYKLRAEPMFQERTDFKDYRKPLAVIFEDSYCSDCEEFHDKVLHHPEVLPELGKFLVVQLNADSNQTITTVNGKLSSPKQWAEQLKMHYRPGIVLFNEGKEQARISGMFYHFHFKEMLRYISGAHYKSFPTFSKYSAARRSELSGQNVIIDYAQ
jgi:thioredoxin-related protein